MNSPENKQVLSRPETSNTDRNSFAFPEFQESTLRGKNEIFEVVDLKDDEHSEETVTVKAPPVDDRPILMFFDVHIGR